jgi:uncharacterized protein YjbI with pentapeptide repeats
MKLHPEDLVMPETLKKLLKRFWWAPIVVILIALIVWAIVMRLNGTPWPEWTGFGDYTGPLTKDQRGKTLWDWLELLIIPAVLAFGALWFNRSEKKNERKIAEERNKYEQEISADRMREAALQTYIDRMTELLLDKGLRKSNPKDEIREVARTRTLSTLRILDPVRKGLLICFLHDADLITKGNVFISLSGADLTKADLAEANLTKVDLTKADLTDAVLSNALLYGASLDKANLTRAVLVSAAMFDATLTGAKLVEANLNSASLNKADFTGATLKKAELKDAILVKANFRRTDLTGADLTRANLSGANLNKVNLTNSNLTEANLEKAYLFMNTLDGANLTGTIMPDGTIHE